MRLMLPMLVPLHPSVHAGDDEGWNDDAKVHITHQYRGLDCLLACFLALCIGYRIDRGGRDRDCDCGIITNHDLDVLHGQLAPEICDARSEKRVVSLLFERTAQTTTNDNMGIG